MKVVMILGSKSDTGHAELIADLLKKDWGIRSDIIVASAHKVPEKVYALLQRLNEEESLVYITIAGRSNALSGVIAANAIHPVIACPPFSDKDDMMVNLHSTLQMPSEVPVLTVVDPNNCALAVARIFGLLDANTKKAIRDRILQVKESFDL